MAQEDELPVKKKGSSKLFLFFFLLLLLGGGGFAAWHFGILDDLLGQILAPSGDAPASPATQLQAQAGPGNTSTVPLPGFMVNLFDPLGRRYIRMDLELEIISPEVGKEVQAMNARIRDTLIMLLSSKTHTELSTPEGKQILRNEILDRLNQVLGGPKVVRVFFNNLVIQ
ncbi:MAG: flagellar basal body-associated FliL family protein [Desulfovibrionaceae bacterium]|nr:flagellar basal body-associated FliL family protein [Desulfovibrionaceae bacterium]